MVRCEITDLTRKELVATADLAWLPRKGELISIGQGEQTEGFVFYRVEEVFHSIQIVAPGASPVGIGSPTVRLYVSSAGTP